jgi:hypothetical protein
MTRLVLVLAPILLVARPASAQDVRRTIDLYDTEIGVRYVVMTEEGGYTGAPGLLVDGGYRLWTYGAWRISGIGELMLVRFDDFDALYKQAAVGVRAGRQLTPRVRAFGQFQLGLQNDGFARSNTGLVIIPGGGLNYALMPSFDVEATFDFPVARYTERWFNQFRLAVGVGIPLGAH